MWGRRARAETRARSHRVGQMDTRPSHLEVSANTWRLATDRPGAVLLTGPVATQSAGALFRSRFGHVGPVGLAVRGRRPYFDHELTCNAVSSRLGTNSHPRRVRLPECLSVRQANRPFPIWRLVFCSVGALSLTKVQVFWDPPPPPQPPASGSGSSVGFLSRVSRSVAGATKVALGSGRELWGRGSRSTLGDLPTRTH